MEIKETSIYEGVDFDEWAEQEDVARYFIIHIFSSPDSLSVGTEFTDDFKKVFAFSEEDPEAFEKKLDEINQEYSNKLKEILIPIEKKVLKRVITEKLVSKNVADYIKWRWGVDNDD